MSKRTQNLLFTLYGDYLQYRGGEASVGSLIELMDCFGTSAQAVRSTLSRMSNAGWFKIRQEGRRSFYSLTPRSISLLAEGTQRIYHPRRDPWDGRWQILVYSIPEKRRHLRSRLRERLVWLGFGLLNQATWISPRNLQKELDVVIDELQIRPYVETFQGVHLGFSSNEEIVERCWNIRALNLAYADFIGRHESQYQLLLTDPDARNSRDDFVRRFTLIHEYRSVPYVDPNLPAELLPNDWLGDRATALFQDYHCLLTDQAEAFVDKALSRTPAIGHSSLTPTVAAIRQSLSFAPARRVLGHPSRAGDSNE